ncbi:FG-GAP-like repeat-containing protein [Polaribacter marinivivus]|uniref:FG-GAP-like repeat-containing protein n=1 Tax=Polaribacter marinivivus TaxID=1524260 RepID=UPI003D32CE03
MKNILFFLLLIVTFNLNSQELITKNNTLHITPLESVTLNFFVTKNLSKKLVLEIYNYGEYAGLSIFDDKKLIADDVNISKKGNHKISLLVKFDKLGETKIRLEVLDAKIKINKLYFIDFTETETPNFKDISRKAGLDKVNSLKYGGPSIADIDNDGDYDFIVNNHNAESSKLYWNNGDGTLTKHHKNLSRWFKHDLHGTALGDYDNDGDLDLMLIQGGGNGKNPSVSNFYLNDVNNFLRFTGDVNINKGGRGRGAKWIDMDLDGDLDLMIFNESSLDFIKPQHFFYENLGNGKFNYKPIKGIEDVEESRVLVTDFNNDQIDDIIFYSPISLWKGNGDFTYTNVSHLLPKNISSLKQIMAIADIDIDNDGDLDLYLARGMQFEHGKGESPSIDFNSKTKNLDFKTRGYKGKDSFDFIAEDFIKLHKYYYLAQGSQLGKPYPIFLGKNKTTKIVNSGEELKISKEMAKGWAKDFSENGFYIGYLGNSKWKAILVRDDNFFWQYKFRLTGVKNVNPKFTPHNRNQPDYLLRNDGTNFTDVSSKWNIPKAGNALGVTVGDFNNDSYQDLFIYRWGRIGERISDIMLLNTGKNSFISTTNHNANAIGDTGNGDMGQAFDFDLDGKVDLLNGSEGGEWYLYKNETNNDKNSVLIRVGYSPKQNIDAISANVTIETETKIYKKRVGSSGAIFSQSLLNIVHFGLGNENKIKCIKIRWRNGETLVFKNKSANKIYDTNNPDPEKISIVNANVREGTKDKLQITVIPKNANKNIKWLSSNNSIISINQKGIISAVGKPNEYATISATSLANNLSTSSIIKIVKWFPKPVKKINIEPIKTSIFVGEEIKLITSVFPFNADDSDLIFKSKNDKILSVNNTGVIKAIGVGKSKISITTKDNSLKTEVGFNIKSLVKPSIEIVNKAQYKKPLIVGDSITVTVKYHAGSGNKVIFSDEGGIRFWLRYFRSKWIPIKDIVITNKEALYTTSGIATVTIPLKNLLPTKELPKEHFYQLRATFTSSDGNMYSDDVLPLQIVDK